MNILNGKIGKIHISSNYNTSEYSKMLVYRGFEKSRTF